MTETATEAKVSANQAFLLKRRDRQQDSHSAAVRAEKALAQAKTDNQVEKVRAEFYGGVTSSRARKYMHRLSAGIEDPKQRLQKQIDIVKQFTTDTTAVLDNLVPIVNRH